MPRMSMASYKYQDVDHDRLINCIHWCQNNFQLRDWEIKLDISINIPKEFAELKDNDYEALCEFDVDSLKGLLWVPLARLEENNNNPLEALIHEMCHIKIAARGIVGGEDFDEGLVRIDSPISYRLYCRDNNLKRAERK